MMHAGLAPACRRQCQRPSAREATETAAWDRRVLCCAAPLASKARWRVRP